jgi:hypothetical protein
LKDFSLRAMLSIKPAGKIPSFSSILCICIPDPALSVVIFGAIEVKMDAMLI